MDTMNKFLRKQSFVEILKRKGWSDGQIESAWRVFEQDFYAQIPLAAFEALPQAEREKLAGTEDVQAVGEYVRAHADQVDWNRVMNVAAQRAQESLLIMSRTPIPEVT